MSGIPGFTMRVGVALCGCLCAVVAAPVPAIAQTYVGVSGQSPADTLARHVKTLATSPRDFNALIGAGRASLAISDEQAAAGFFGRAEEVSPQSPQPQIGMGAALAQSGDARAALQYFARAVQFGATRSMVGLDRGLAFDLLGDHALAQADYRTALGGPERDEARRRLALSLGISGKKDEALDILAPLMAKGDAAGARCRAFVLALSGDSTGAKAAIEAAMPGSAQSMAYFFHRLPSLRSEQKAAAVHLGMFPDAEQLAGVAPPASNALAGSAVSSANTDRLASIDDLLRSSAPPVTRQQAAPAPAPPVRVASIRRPPVRTAISNQESDGKVYAESRIWLQLASGTNAAELPGEFSSLKLKYRTLLKGIDGYVAQDGRRSRLLIGPFRNRDEAQIFADDLQSVRVDSFRWSNKPGQIIAKLAE